MCHNVIDGRFHTQCGHFYAMATQKQDCLSMDCVFSARHIHGCKKTNCMRLMAPPARNPIRVSPTFCSECTERRRVGVLGLGLGHVQTPQLVSADGNRPSE